MAAYDQSGSDSPDRVAARIEITPLADPPRSWFHIFLGYCALAAVAIAAGALLIQFMGDRPRDMREPAALVANVLQESLRGYVPIEQIHKSAAEPRRTEDGRWLWNYYRFDVELPNQINLEGIKQLVRDDILLHAARLVDSQDGGGEAAWSIVLGDYEIASVVLRRKLPRKALRKDLRAINYEITRELKDVLEEFGIPRESLEEDEALRQEDDYTIWALTRIRSPLPQTLTLGEIRGRIGLRMRKHAVNISAIDRDSGPLALRLAYEDRDCVELLFTPAGAARAAPAPPPSPAQEEQAAPPAPARSSSAKIAIILDDGGQSLETLEQVLKLDVKLTLSILPNALYSSESAMRAESNGFEVMLHMPMETNDPEAAPYPGRLTTAMTRVEIQRLTLEALSQMPEVRGVNNHEGSKFTGDPSSMQHFLEVLKGRSLYFVDSLTAPTSTAYAQARKENVPTARRDIFLDHDPDPAQIRAQLEKLANLAKERGSAVGIGHFHTATPAILAQELPRLQGQGIELVYASELVQ